MANASEEKLFEPYTAGSLELRNRLALHDGCSASRFQVLKLTRIDPALS